MRQLLQKRILLTDCWGGGGKPSAVKIKRNFWPALIIIYILVHTRRLYDEYYRSSLHNSHDMYSMYSCTRCTTHTRMRHTCVRRGSLFRAFTPSGRIGRRLRSAPSSPRSRTPAAFSAPSSPSPPADTWPTRSAGRQLSTFQVSQPQLPSTYNIRIRIIRVRRHRTYKYLGINVYIYMT